MKKVFLLLVLALSFSVSAQKTYTIENPLVLKTVNPGTKSDSLLVRGSDKKIKTIPRSEFLEGLDTLYVHKTGEFPEIVDGDKTFERPVAFRGNATDTYSRISDDGVKYIVRSSYEDGGSVEVTADYGINGHYQQKHQGKNGMLALLGDAYSKDETDDLLDLKANIGEGVGSGNVEQPLNTILYESYGDSFTVGQAASAGYDYVTLFKNKYALLNTNRGVSGSGITSVAGLHNANVNYGSNKFVSVMSGFNDVYSHGNSAKNIAKIKNGYRAILVNQFLFSYLSASNVSVTKSGTWSSFSNSSYGGKTTGLSSVNSGNYAEYSIVSGTDNLVIAMTGSDGSTTYGTFDVAIDGVTVGSYTLNNQTTSSNTRSPFVLYFSGLEEKPHTIRVTQTSNDLINIDYFGVIDKPKVCTPILIMEIPKMNAAGYALTGGVSSDAVVNQLNTEINNVISEFDPKYPIYIGKTNDFYDVATGVDADNVHPKNLGHTQLYNAALDAMKDIPLQFFSKNNIFTGTNEFREVVNLKNGAVVRGTVPAISGSGIEFNGGTTPQMLAYNRDAGQYVQLSFYGANYRWIDGSSNIMMHLTTARNLLIGTNTDIPSSKLTVESTTQGVLLPRMTTAQKNAISSPQEGLEVYDLTLKKKCFYNGTAWETVTSL